MENKHKIMGIIGLVALRKSELYYKVIKELPKEKQLSKDDREKIKKYISEMENERLLSKVEKRDKKINSQLKLKDIGLDIKKVVEEVNKI